MSSAGSSSSAYQGGSSGSSGSARTALQEAAAARRRSNLNSANERGAAAAADVGSNTTNASFVVEPSSREPQLATATPAAYQAGLIRPASGGGRGGRVGRGAGRGTRLAIPVPAAEVVADGFGTPRGPELYEPRAPATLTFDPSSAPLLSRLAPSLIDININVVAGLPLILADRLVQFMNDEERVNRAVIYDSARRAWESDARDAKKNMAKAVWADAEDTLEAILVAREADEKERSAAATARADARAPLPTTTNAIIILRGISDASLTAIFNLLKGYHEDALFA